MLVCPTAFEMRMHPRARKVQQMDHMCHASIPPH